MRFTTVVAPILGCLSFCSAQALDASTPDGLKTSARQVAASIKALQDPNTGILPLESWYWWISGSTLDGLATYFHTTKDAQYNQFIANALSSQASGANDFMMPGATGNDDQAWWALAAMSAAEYGIAPPVGKLPWIQLATNVYNEQKGRWRTDKCNGGLKWKINTGDAGWSYRSTISNGLFFQLAARLYRYTGNADALTWAEKAYDWTTSVGLIDGQYNVFDGTDDEKGANGCADVNHNQWSYNTAVFLYGSAVLFQKTGDPKWKTRADGYLGSIKRNFVKGGALFEMLCENNPNPNGQCNTDQQSFKGVLARWLGATATLLPDMAEDIRQNITSSATRAISAQYVASWNPMQQLGALEIMDAGLCYNWGGAPAIPGVAQKRSVAGRIMF